MPFILFFGTALVLLMYFVLRAAVLKNAGKRSILLFNTLYPSAIIVIFLLYNFHSNIEKPLAVQVHSPIQINAEKMVKDINGFISVETEMDNAAEIHEAENIEAEANLSAVIHEVQYEKDKIAYINVSVATLWSAPNITRSIDSFSSGIPADISKWVAIMSMAEKEWLIGNLETQGLYGQKVTILEQKEDWVKAAIFDQPTPKSAQGYAGWMPINQLIYDEQFANAADHNSFAIVMDSTVWLYNDQQLKDPFLEISFNTRLPVISLNNETALVVTPDGGRKWISSKAISIYESEKEIPKPTGQELVQMAKQFLGLPYLWAGTSGFGFDCSGFTYSIYKASGITIPRDSSDQAVHGVFVHKNDLKEGDLLFFANNNGKGSIHHVGMYIGNGEMIHAPNFSKPLEIIKVFESEYWSAKFAGARRYIDL